MAAPTYTEAIAALGRGAGTFFAQAASGKNPDETPYALPVAEGVPAAADILVGHLAHTATTGATTFLTIAAGRTWVGEVGVVCDVSVAATNTAAGQALGVITTAGAGVTPAAGTVLSSEARAGANAATGTVGSQGAVAIRLPLTVVAPVGNAVTLALTSTIVGVGRVAVSASGRLV